MPIIYVCPICDDKGTMQWVVGKRAFVHDTNEDCEIETAADLYRRLYP